MVNLSAFKDLDNLMKVLKYALDHSVGLGVNLQVLTRFYLEHLLHVKADRWNKEYRAAYMRLYRFFSALSRENYVELRNVGGLVWVKPAARAVDLIEFYARKTQTRKTLKRLHEMKYSARRYVSRKRRLFGKDWELLFGFFEGYLEDVDNRILVFRNEFTGEFLVKRYSHRFQRRYLRKVREKFDRIEAMIKN